MRDGSPYSPTTAPYSPEREREEEKFEAVVAGGID